jgi:integrase
MTRAVIQDYLFKIVEEGKHRTAEKLCQILTCIFDLACEDLGITSPMKKIVLPYYETKKGICFTYAEERKLVDFCIQNKENAASSALLVLLYFGLRKSELHTITVENEKLTCVTSKTRFGKGEVKRTIPFTPVFKRVLPYVDFDKAKATNIHTVETTFKRLFPDHHPHELRYTFITRCKECGVAGEVVMLLDGHTQDRDVKTSVVDRGYTTYSEEFIRKEVEKVDYKF